MLDVLDQRYLPPTLTLLPTAEAPKMAKSTEINAEAYGSHKCTTVLDVAHLGRLF